MYRVSVVSGFGLLCLLLLGLLDGRAERGHDLVDAGPVQRAGPLGPRAPPARPRAPRPRRRPQRRQQPPALPVQRAQRRQQRDHQQRRLPHLLRQRLYLRNNIRFNKCISILGDEHKQELPRASSTKFRKYLFPEFLFFFFRNLLLIRKPIIFGTGNFKTDTVTKV